METINPLGYYIPPFRQDEIYIFDSEHNMTAMFRKGVGKDSKQKLVDTLNGTSKEKVFGTLAYKPVDVCLNGSPILTLRGWGHLTGTGGGLGLPEETAAKIQDAMGEWIVRKLKGE